MKEPDERMLDNGRRLWIVGFVFSLLVREFGKGKGRHDETWICVAAHERIGGRCVVVISWNLLVLPCMLLPLRTQVIPLSYQLK